MIQLKGASWGWNNQILYKQADVAIERGMRMVVLGPNGCGKSTFLAALSGKLPLIEGKRNIAESLDIGLFTQDLAQDLDLNAVALDLVMEVVQKKDPTINTERARTVLGSLGITGSKSLQKIGTMSGGEKARVALANFVLVPHNLLILDEPSNHLDVGTVKVLTDALIEYKGTIIVVTHNRPFAELLNPTHVATVMGEPGAQTIKIEERPLRPGDWAGMQDTESASGVPGSTRTMDRALGTSTLSKKKGAKASGTKTLSKASAKVEEEAPARELYPWELEGATDSGLKINKQGKMVSTEKKLTPQQALVLKSRVHGEFT
jgi:ATP-binding cassette subfamily F protein 3